MNFVGYAPLGQNFTFPVRVRNSSNVPKDADSLPPFRAYSGAGLMANGTGTAAKLDTGSITGATNTSPIVITSANHGLTTGTKVVVANVGGNTAANGEFQITRLSDNTFSLDGSVGNGPYTSGGDWHVAGLYTATIPVTAGNSYEAGKTYFVLVTWAISAVVGGDVYAFVVV